MWGPLQHPGHVKSYEEFHQYRRNPDEDWLPMARAVQHLQSLPAASKLYAFTAMRWFHVTMSPSYAEAKRHSSVSVIWRLGERRFHLAFGSLAGGWVEDRLPEVICEEPALSTAVEPFIQRLLASSP
jgi:hypothetical protein